MRDQECPYCGKPIYGYKPDRCVFCRREFKKDSWLKEFLLDFSCGSILLKLFIIFIILVLIYFMPFRQEQRKQYAITQTAEKVTAANTLVAVMATNASYNSSPDDSYADEIKIEEARAIAEKTELAEEAIQWATLQVDEVYMTAMAKNSGAQSASCVIKGNIGFDSGEKIYHVPGQKYYNSTTINTEYGERWFCTEEEARAAGWRKSQE